jgi:O-antigen/teichoic acid export membrane protein
MASIIKRIVDRVVPGGSLSRSVAVLAGGSGAAQLIGLAAAPFLTRLYTPEHFGAAAIYASILGLLTVIASGRYELAIPLPKDDGSALDVLVLAIGTAMATAGLCGLGICFGGEWLTTLTRAELLRPYLWLLPIGVLGGGFNQALSYFNIRRKSYKRLAQTRLSQSISSAAVGLGVGFVRHGPLGLLLASLLGQTAGTLTLAGEALRVARKSAFRPTLKRLREAAYEYRNFPIYSTGAGLLNSAGLNLPSLLLSSFYGNEVTGWFGLAYRVISLPMGLVGQAVGQVFLGEAARIMHESPAQLLGLFKRVSLRLLQMSLIVLVLGAFSPFVFRFAFGERWTTAGYYAAFMAIASCAQLVTSPISMVAVLLKRQDLQLWMDLFRLIVVLSMLSVPPLLGMSGLLTVALYAVAMSILYIQYFLVYWYLLVRMVKRC